MRSPRVNADVGPGCYAFRSMASNMSRFECNACGATRAHDVSRGHVPPGWRMRRIGSRVFQLCEGCGGDGAFIGGPAPILVERLRARGFDVGEG